MMTTKTELEALRKSTENLTDLLTNAILNGDSQTAEQLKKLLEVEYAKFQKALAEQK